MTDRDYFAAAALAGLLDKTDASNDLAAWWPEMACCAAYRWADAMLRERERTNLDAEPAAKVAEPESSVPLGSECGTGNTQEPVAWLVKISGRSWLCSYYPYTATEAHGAEIIPLYRSPPTCPYVVGRTTLHCSLTPLAEKERAQLQSEIDRLRAAIRRLADQDATLSVCDGNVTVSMDGTLTDEEREAIELATGDYIYHQDPGGRAQHIGATLLGLLERTK